MERIRAPDGTWIAFERSGTGPPLLLVHGTGADHTRWAPVLPALEERFTVLALDRRGRGGSSDAPTYAIEREFEDIAAVVDAMGEGVNLLGHSYGAWISLEAALQTQHLRRLILYEPPMPAGEAHDFSPSAIASMEASLAKGQRDAAATTFMREIVRVSPRELELLRATPAWQARVAAVHTVLRELAAVRGRHLDVTRFQNLTTPTLLLVGSESPVFLKRGVDALHAALPHNRLVVLAGQGHVAMNTAPDLFLREVLEFLAEAR